MTNIDSVKIKYMGRVATLGNICKYDSANVSKCPDLSQVGALVYMHSIMNQFEFSSVDEAMGCASECPDFINFIAVKIVIIKGMKSVGQEFIDLLEEKDEDIKWDMLRDFAMSNLK